LRFPRLEERGDGGAAAFGSRVYETLGVETDPFYLEQTDLLAAVAPRATAQRR